jgi:hypothetical protein
MDAAVAVDAHTSVHRSLENRRERGFPQRPYASNHVHFTASPTLAAGALFVVVGAYPAIDSVIPNATPA